MLIEGNRTAKSHLYLWMPKKLLNSLLSMTSGPHLSSSFSHTVHKLLNDVLWCGRSPAGLAASTLAMRRPRPSRPGRSRQCRPQCGSAADPPRPSSLRLPSPRSSPPRPSLQQRPSRVTVLAMAFPALAARRPAPSSAPHRGCNRPGYPRRGRPGPRASATAQSSATPTR